MSIPAAPPKDPRSRRYPVSMVREARLMYGDGDAWTPTQIRDYLRKTRGAPGLTLCTVRLWVIPGEAEAHNARRRRQSVAVTPETEMAQARFWRLRKLREAGMSCGALAILARVDWALELTEWDVRYICEVPRITGPLTLKLEGRTAEATE